MRIKENRRTLILIGLVAVAAGGVAYAAIPDGSRVIHACVLNTTKTIRLIDTANPRALTGHCVAGETPLDWNQAGTPGPAGAPGTPGGAGATYYAHTNIPATVSGPQFQSNLHLDVPAGSYVVTASVQVDSTGSAFIPMLCALTSPTTTGETFAAALRPGVVDAQTISLGMATTLTAPGRIDLVCLSNTAEDGASADVEGRQITATTVGAVFEQPQ